MKVISRGGLRAVVGLLIVAAALGVAACGGASRTNGSTAVRSCRNRQAAPHSSLAAVIACEFPAQRRCPSGHTLAALTCATVRHPGFERVFFEIRLRFLPAWIACIARNGYKLPTPNTSGKGPVFPAGTDRIGKYRAAGLHCMSIERQEVHALMLAERS